MSATPTAVRIAPPDDAHPREILDHVARFYGARICIASSLGPQTLVILDLLHELRHTVPVFLLDTGVLFAETYALRRRVEEHFGIEIRAVTPEAPAAEGLWATDPARCCHLRKVAPLRDTLAGFDAWITGVRRDQSSTRARARILEWDEQFGLVKVNPLAHWSRAEVDDHLSARGVPTNPLLDQGYRSVGCWPCTTPVTPGGAERDGRWAGLARTECGIHRDTPGGS